MLISEEKHYFIILKYDFIEWIETWVLLKTINKNVIKFVKKKLVYQHEEYEILIINEDFKNKFLMKNLIKKFK